jgi:predicted unusual protein kinase regulating ubiquinone biosynthesis (AarF/ABC1/UbiB family)
VIGFIDCGLVHAVDERLRRQQGRYIEAVYAADPERIHDALMDLLEATSDASAEAFRSDLFAATRRWIERASCPDPPPQERSAIADYMIEVVRAAQRRGFRLPASALGMYRAMLTADSVASWLGSPLSIVRVGRAFFRRLRVDELVESLMPNASRVSALGLAADLASMPGNVSRLLSDLADERFVLEARTSDSAEDKRDADLRARLVTLGIMSVGFAILLAAAIARRPAAPLVVGFGLSLLACYVALFLTWRRLR